VSGNIFELSSRICGNPHPPSALPAANPQSYQPTQHKGHKGIKTESSNRLPNKMYIWQPGRGHLKQKRRPTNEDRGQGTQDAERKRNLI